MERSGLINLNDLIGSATDINKSNEPMTRREKSKAEKLQQIRSAALLVFLEKGYHKAAISDILRYTNLARGTFYLYYQDKSQIFDDLLADLYKDITLSLGQLEIENQKSKKAFYEQLKNLARTLLDVFRRHEKLVIILVSSSIGRDSVFDRRVEGFYEILTEVIRVLASRGIESGYLKPHNTLLLSRLLIGGLKEFIFQWLVKKRYTDDLEAEIESIVFIFMKGVEQ
ncbi:MAG: TetR/AcrR family transcriptional regulator [Leptospiraceae bacterium]|nr:TetR/AcrR family transcriptional regulator [Leptospiraceae bacterium]MCB1199417.1 TetR/AcrR family transcriptional regulator [Leptospiraceae bacterium]